MIEPHELESLGFKEDTPPKPIDEKKVFKNRNIVMDDTRVLGICKKSDIDPEVLRAEYTVAQYKVDLLQRVLALAKQLEKFTEEKDLYILLPIKKSKPLFIMGAKQKNENVYTLAPRWSEWLELSEEPRKGI